MNPSKEAIEAAEKIYYEGFRTDADDPKLTRMLKAAYDIDFAALQAENERLQAEVERLKKWICLP